METRIITQVKIYKLILNHVKDKYEVVNIRAISTEYDKLVSWYNDQLVDPYKDERFEGESWYKVFKQDAPLEWFNPARSLNVGEHDARGVGIQEEWVDLGLYHSLISGNHEFYIVL